MQRSHLAQQSQHRNTPPTIHPHSNTLPPTAVLPPRDLPLLTATTQFQRSGRKKEIIQSQIQHNSLQINQKQPHLSQNEHSTAVEADVESQK